MTEWLSYSLSDFLLFSPRTYWRMIAAGNEFLWPLQLATVLIGAGLAIPQEKLHAWGRATPFLVLSLLWCFVGWRFFWLEYAPINWIAPYAAGAFFIQAIALASLAFAGSTPHKGPTRGARAAGPALTLYGLVLHPLTPLLWERELATADVFGIAPDSTAVVTAGLLLMHWRRAMTPLLLIVPVGWLVFSGLTHLAFPDPQGWLLLALAGGIIVSVVSLFASRVRD